MYIPTGTRKVSEILQKFGPDKVFVIQYDPDVDGVISGELVRRILVTYGRPHFYYINDNRTHGFKMSDAEIEHLVGKVLIFVDASMSYEDLKKLTSRGVDVIAIDHHAIPYQELVYLRNPQTGCEGIIINNQYPFEPEEYRFLSGAGVVYYVFKAIFPELFGQEEKALVGLSLLSDVRPIENPIAQDFLYTTYHIDSPLFQYFVDLTKGNYDFGFGVPVMDRNFIDYTFCPKVNALFRLNKGEDAIRLFMGQFDSSLDLDIYRNVQNAIVDSIIENLQGEEFSNLVCKYVPSNLSLPYNFGLTNFIGLACSRIKNAGKTAFLFVEEDGKVKRGSVRGLCDGIDYLNLFRQYGFKAEGHKNAFGVLEVDFANVDFAALNNAIAELELGYKETRYQGRILEVSNLSFFLNSPNIKLADYNNYLRDSYRYYVKYVGSNVVDLGVNKSGKLREYEVDGVRVKSFDPTLDFHNALILPIKERRSYINFFLRPY